MAGNERFYGLWPLSSASWMLLGFIAAILAFWAGFQFLLDSGRVAGAAAPAVAFKSTTAPALIWVVPSARSTEEQALLDKWASSNLHACLTAAGYDTAEAQVKVLAGPGTIFLRQVEPARDYAPNPLALSWLEGSELFVFRTSPDIGSSFDQLLTDSGCPA